MSRGARAGPLWSLGLLPASSHLVKWTHGLWKREPRAGPGGGGGRRSPGLQASLPPCLMGAEIKADAGLYILQLTKAPNP